MDKEPTAKPLSAEDLKKVEDLTPEDKEHLKQYYLQECVTPRIREAVKKYFPEEFSGQRPGNKRKIRFPTRSKTHDRPSGRSIFQLKTESRRGDTIA